MIIYITILVPTLELYTLHFVAVYTRTYCVPDAAAEESEYYNIQTDIEKRKSQTCNRKPKSIIIMYMSGLQSVKLSIQIN